MSESTTSTTTLTILADFNNSIKSLYCRSTTLSEVTAE